MLRGSSGKISMMRLAVLIVVITIMLVFLAHNVLAMAVGIHTIVTLGTSETAIIIGVLAAKAGQSFSETKNNMEVTK